MSGNCNKSFRSKKFIIRFVIPEIKVLYYILLMYNNIYILTYNIYYYIILLYHITILLMKLLYYKDITSAREACAFRHHGVRFKGLPETPRTSRQYGTEEFQSNLNF